MSGLRKRKKLNSAYLVTFKNKKNSKVYTGLIATEFYFERWNRFHQRRGTAEEWSHFRSFTHKLIFHNRIHSSA